MQINHEFLKVEGLSKTYVPGAAPVFENVNFDIAQGEFVCIIGHSGCGKTTILNVLAGLEEASSGYAYMLGREIKGPSLERGVVFQGHALMPWMTVLQNINFAVKSKFADWPKAKIEEHSEKYLDLVGLSAAKHKRPAELSGGMKQRVGIARTLLKNPPILILDEATSALDTQTERDIQDSLREMGQGRSVITIAHRLSTIADADCILVLEDGRVTEQGRHDQVHHEQRQHQVEHHIFPHISHIHYGKLAKIVKETALEFNLPYNEYKTFTKAIIEHFNQLKTLGAKPAYA